jgi:FdhD protein
VSRTPARRTGRNGASTEIAVARILRHRAGAKPAVARDRLVREEPLEIRIRGRSIAVTMRTPGHDRELTAGFLFTERVIRERQQLKEIAVCRGSLAPENTLDVFLAADVEVDLAQLTRHVFASSSCGLCGKATIAAVQHHFPPVNSAVGVTAKMLTQLPARMKRAQRTFAQTGGLHAAAIFDSRGRLVALREDVGRHNAVDKVIGQGFLDERLPFDRHILLVSGRASFEIMQKALAARVPIVCAVSAPSSLAVDFSRAGGQTLVGFLRDGGMNVYCGEHRIRA